MDCCTGVADGGCQPPRGSAGRSPSAGGPIKQGNFAKNEADDKCTDAVIDENSGVQETAQTIYEDVFAAGHDIISWNVCGTSVATVENILRQAVINYPQWLVLLMQETFSCNELNWQHPSAIETGALGHDCTGKVPAIVFHPRIMRSGLRPRPWKCARRYIICFINCGRHLRIFVTIHMPTSYGEQDNEPLLAEIDGEIR